MKQDYFVYNGARYPCGTQIKISLPLHNNHTSNGLAYFVYYNTEYDVVWCKMCYTRKKYGLSMEEFLKRLEGITGKRDPSISVPEAKRLKDYQIPKLLVGWVWYIFIMLFLTITTSAIAGWIIFSIIFFIWRSNVIKKEGYYVEWQI